KDTPMVGRTHGVHAEPTTFGLKLANWYSETQRHAERLARAAEEVRVGRLAGAVGTYAHGSPDIERRICERLDLQPAAVSSQVIQRDRHAYYLSTLAVLAASLEKIALEIRHLQRTEVREVEEYFGASQRGSSSMPHKRNPILAEQLCGLARLVRAHAQAALENVPLWHERDISHSSVERVILPDSTILVDYMLDNTATLIEHLRVFPQRMKKNLELTRGLVFSEGLLLELVKKGAPREEAYAWVQGVAAKAWEADRDFQQAVLTDKRITEKLSKKEIDAVFDLRHALRHVDAIFHRVFG
ncbi:MAG: adenylosuccinate lyase, partial [Candidatus Acidoferrales bacterium]